jgi:hypothetical protein
MSQPVWTEETEERVARAVHVAECEWDWDECRAGRQHIRAAREVLNALHDDGVLLPHPWRREASAG